MSATRAQAGQDQTNTPRPPSGRDIWNAIKEELLGNLYPLPFSTIAPTLYHVYLHQEDYDEIEGIVPRIVSELAKALTGEVQRINEERAGRAARVWSFVRQEASDTPVEVPAGGWEIYIQPDHDGELERGSFGIVSRLMMPAPPSFGGTPTARIVRSVFTEGRRTSTMTNVQAAVDAASSVSDAASDAAPGAAPEAAQPSEAAVRSAPAPEEAPRSAPPSDVAVRLAAPSDPAIRSAAPTIRATPPPRAVLTYEDDRGPHRFSVQKDLIKIGRGGDGAWVDVELMTSAHVSREHCWILSDADGRFFVQDVSTRGTSVNGERLPAPVRSPEGKVAEPGAKRELASDAQISLADTVTLRIHVGPVP